MVGDSRSALSLGSSHPGNLQQIYPPRNCQQNCTPGLLRINSVDLGKERGRGSLSHVLPDHLTLAWCPRSTHPVSVLLAVITPWRPGQRSTDTASFPLHGRAAVRVGQRPAPLHTQPAGEVTLPFPRCQLMRSHLPLCCAQQSRISDTGTRLPLGNCSPGQPGTVFLEHILALRSVHSFQVL